MVTTSALKSETESVDISEFRVVGPEGLEPSTKGL